MAKKLVDMEWEYLTIETDDNEFVVYGHGTYGRGSVLEGHPKRAYLKSFKTVEDAKTEYPDAEESGSTKVYGNPMPSEPPAWFDPMDAGEAWGEDDY